MFADCSVYPELYLWTAALTTRVVDAARQQFIVSGDAVVKLCCGQIVVLKR